MATGAPENNAAEGTATATATVFILDGSSSMKTSFSPSSSRFSAAKQAVLTCLEDIRSSTDSCNHHLVSVSLLQTTKTAVNAPEWTNHCKPLCPQLIDPSTSPSLINRLRFVEATSDPIVESNFCKGIVGATEVLAQGQPLKEQQHRIVLVTDASSTVRMDPQEILVTIDRLREMKCRLEVIGICFSSSSVYEEPAAAPKSGEKERTDDETACEDESDSDGDESESASDDDQDDQAVLTYESKTDREALLRSIVEKTGGSITAVNTLEEMLRAVTSLVAHVKKAGSKISVEGNDDDVIIDDDLSDDKTNFENRPSRKRERENNDSSEWACPRCTFLNPSTARVCICDWNRCDGDTNDHQQPLVQQNLVATSRSHVSSSSTNSHEIRDRIRALSGGRFIWEGPDVESIDDWLDAVRPSQLTTLDCAWIQLSNPKTESPVFWSPEWQIAAGSSPGVYMPTLDKNKTKIDQGKEQGKRVTISAKEKKACMASLVKTATEKGDTIGKWLIFTIPEKADEIWRKIATATAQGKLGCSSKILPAGDSDSDRIPCCVYVKDFNDRSEVKRVLRVLVEELELWVTCFKPDFMTSLGINSGNEWRLDPRLYTVKEVLEW